MHIRKLRINSKKLARIRNASLRQPFIPKTTLNLRRINFHKDELPKDPKLKPIIPRFIPDNKQLSNTLL